MVSYSGKTVKKRFEDPRLLTGKGSFVDDIVLPGMLHVYVLRSPHAHAHIRSIDVSPALRLPGVVTVLTGEDLTGVLKAVPAEVMPDQAAPSEGGRADEMTSLEQPVLATNKVCYVGQAVAMVVAQERYLARDAAELVEVDYELLPLVLDPLEAMKDDAVPVHQELGTNVELRIFREGGDLEAAFAQADRIVRQRFEVPRLAPAPMENRGVVAHHRSQDDSLTVWDSTQEPYNVRSHLAEALDRPESSVRVIAPDVGGGFGEKGSMFPEELSVPYLSIILGRPVKWVEDRQENMLAFHGRGHTVDVEAAVKNDGSILGMRVRLVADLGAYCVDATAIVPLLAAHRIAGPYGTPAMSVEVPWRGNEQASHRAVSWRWRAGGRLLYGAHCRPDSQGAGLGPCGGKEEELHSIRSLPLHDTHRPHLRLRRLFQRAGPCTGAGGILDLA